MSTGIEISLIVFAFNEQDNVVPVLTEIDDWATSSQRRLEIVFVDDGSRDSTFETAKSVQLNTKISFVQHPQNGGIGAALKTGVRHASGEWVTFMPADGQIDPRELSTLIDAQRASKCDLVTSVYADRDDGLRRTVLSWGVRTLIKVFHGVTMTSDGPYLFQKADFDESVLKPNSFFLNFEFPIRMLAASKGVEVVTISCRSRMSGQSKSSGLKTIFIIGKDLIGLRLRRFSQ